MIEIGSTSEMSDFFCQALLGACRTPIVAKVKAEQQQQRANGPCEIGIFYVVVVVLRRRCAVANYLFQLLLL